MTFPGITSSLTPGENLGPQIRLLICYECKTVDELPDWDGPPEKDTILKVSIDRHHTDPITGREHAGRLGKVPIKYWTRPEIKSDILRQIREGTGGLNEIDAEFYDSRSTFFDDAMACYNQHLRPKGMCYDWKDDSKRLIPGTDKDRKELGLAKAGETGPKVWLCDFCPVKTFVMTKERSKAGMYDK